MWEIGPVHITWALIFWEVASVHGVVSRTRQAIFDRRQLRANRIAGYNGPLEDYGTRIVAESIRWIAIFAFCALLGAFSSLLEPRAPASGGAVLVSWGLVAILCAVSFSDYVVMGAVRRVRHRR